MIPKCTDWDFFRYRYGKYQEIPTDTDRKIPIWYTTLEIYSGNKTRVVHQISIFWLVSVGISWYLPYWYRRKSRLVHFGIIFLAGTPSFPQKGGTGYLFEGKRGHRPTFWYSQPPFCRKKEFLPNYSYMDRNTDSPVKSDTVHLTSTAHPVPGNEEFRLAPSETIVELVKK